MNYRDEDILRELNASLDLLRTILQQARYAKQKLPDLKPLMLRNVPSYGHVAIQQKLAVADGGITDAITALMDLDREIVRNIGQIGDR